MNSTRNYDDGLIDEADAKLEAAEAASDRAGLAVSAQHRAINTANSSCDNAREQVLRRQSLCDAPAPPQNCLEDLQAAEDTWYKFSPLNPIFR